ncbi:ubiquinone biosynthesis accessory factor UbiJ [Colwellia sp. TT2012]|uniref:ubiquinone biosynthesis accessory factor UbiJ n=1 Tax=Colwellia sp. TT2012 TaxID=1720342 RepID=UPI00070A3188|nr:SCP2 sterol-binding domain-containing protein [Colwellia sp. TT2012]
MRALNNQAFTQISTQLNSKLRDSLLLPQVVTATLELIMNKALALNHNKAISFAELKQKTLTLELAELSFPLSFTVNTSDSSAVVIVRSQTDSSDCTIKTSIKALKKLKAKQSLTQLIKQDELDVSGDIKIAQQFTHITQSLAIDWQSELARHLGDVPTHKLLQFSDKISKSISATAKQIETDISEYLVHEKRLLVTISEVTVFNRQAKELANEVNVISARIDQIFADLAEK